jgi:TPR repeat protein
LKRAEALYEHAHKACYLNATNNLGSLCKARGNLKRAEALYEKAHKRGQPDATYILGLLCEERGDCQRAGSLYEQAQRLGNTHASLRWATLLERNALGCFEEAHRGGTKEGAMALSTLFLNLGDQVQLGRTQQFLFRMRFCGRTHTHTHAHTHTHTRTHVCALTHSRAHTCTHTPVLMGLIGGNRKEIWKGEYSATMLQLHTCACHRWFSKMKLRVKLWLDRQPRMVVGCHGDEGP